MNFLAELYQSDKFTLYLTIALVVLVVLFVIVLIFGKRDQKLEETKRLQKIDLDNFKEEKTEPTKLEVKEENIPTVVEMPNTEVDIATSPVEEKEEQVVAMVDESVNVITFEPSVTETVETEETPEIKTNEEPLKTEEDKPLFGESDNNQPIAINELPEVNFEEVDLEKDLNELESIKNAFDEIELPKDDEEPIKETSKLGPQIFSSVFVDNKTTESPLSNEEEKITVVEPTPEVPEKNSLFTIEEDEEDFELPSLKNTPTSSETSEEKETPLFSENEEKSFNFDDVSGETYNLK